MSDQPWKDTQNGDRPGDLCCRRAAGEFCYEHDPSNWVKLGDKLVLKCDIPTPTSSLLYSKRAAVARHVEMYMADHGWDANIVNVVTAMNTLGFLNVEACREFDPDRTQATGIPVINPNLPECEPGQYYWVKYDAEWKPAHKGQRDQWTIDGQTVFTAHLDAIGNKLDPVDTHLLGDLK